MRMPKPDPADGTGVKAPRCDPRAKAMRPGDEILAIYIISCKTMGGTQFTVGGATLTLPWWLNATFPKLVIRHRAPLPDEPATSTPVGVACARATPPGPRHEHGAET